MDRSGPLRRRLLQRLQQHELPDLHVSPRPKKEVHPEESTPGRHVIPAERRETPVSLHPRPDIPRPQVRESRTKAGRVPQTPCAPEGPDPDLHDPEVAPVLQVERKDRLVGGHPKSWG